MNRSNKISIAVFFIFVAICIAYVMFRTNDLQKNGIILQGKILDNVIASKSSVMQFRFEFEYNERKYINDSPAGVNNTVQFIGKTFPVRFSLKTGNSEILIIPRQFERYKMDYPDSLAWVKQYLIVK